jgi:5-methylcytosine-specific restriction endonuclease McrA
MSGGPACGSGSAVAAGLIVTVISLGNVSWQPVAGCQEAVSANPVIGKSAGKCTECRSTFDLQYDHVIPVALGGATTVENLQLLCSDCNLQKGADL